MRHQDEISKSENDMLREELLDTCRKQQEALRLQTQRTEKLKIENEALKKSHEHHIKLTAEQLQVYKKFICLLPGVCRW